jgi:hypothetical protein
MHPCLIPIGHPYRRGVIWHCFTKPAKQEAPNRYTRWHIINHSYCSIALHANLNHTQHGLNSLAWSWYMHDFMSLCLSSFDKSSGTSTSQSYQHKSMPPLQLSCSGQLNGNVRPIAHTSAGLDGATGPGRII